MTNCNTRTTPAPDLHALGQAVYSIRAELRAMPYDIQAACELARQMVQEQESFDMEDGRTPYNTTRALDGLLAMIAGTTAHLGRQIDDSIGEYDDDLPTITPPAPRAAEPAPTVEEMRATWQKVADHAAEQLAALNAADQGKAGNGGNPNVTLNQKAADALDKLAIGVGGLKYRNNVASSLILDRLDEMSEGEPQ